MGATSDLLHRVFPHARSYDLLDTEISNRLLLNPHLLREELLSHRPATVVIDEIQKVPVLLEEVHWLLENTSTHFILSGSSARKLRREARNLLGGRAIETQLFPLTSAEIPDFNLDKYLRHRGIPVHYLVPDPSRLLHAYVNNYIKEEIIDESLTRNIPAFARFLQVVALTHGQQLNFANIARECGVSPSTVRSYFQILKDTQLGFELEPWRRAHARRLTGTARFYLFDVCVANYLHPESAEISPGSDRYGRAFEHFLIMEIRAYLAYRGISRQLAFWRTSAGHEVDLIVGDMQLALEFKSATLVRPSDLKGLRTLKDEFTPARSLVISRDSNARTTEDGIEMLPWSESCRRLWSGEVIAR